MNTEAAASESSAKRDRSRPSRPPAIASRAVTFQAGTSWTVTPQSAAIPMDFSRPEGLAAWCVIPGASGRTSMANGASRCGDAGTEIARRGATNVSERARLNSVGTKLQDRTHQYEQRVRRWDQPESCIGGSWFKTGALNWDASSAPRRQMRQSECVEDLEGIEKMMHRRN